MRLLWWTCEVCFFFFCLEEIGFEEAEDDGFVLDEDILREILWDLYDGSEGQSLRRQSEWGICERSGRCSSKFLSMLDCDVRL